MAEGTPAHFRILIKHLSLLGPTPKLLFIPLACDPEHWDDGLDRISYTFSTIKFHNIDMCLDLGLLSWSYLKKFDAIYIDGGIHFNSCPALDKPTPMAPS